MRKFDAIVIGGGVIGGSIAYELSKSNFKTALVEKSHPGAGASGASAAMIEFQVDAHRGEPFFSLAKASHSLFPSLISELQSLVGNDSEYQSNGIIHKAVSSVDEDTLKKEITRQKSIGLQTDWLDPEILEKKMPYLTSDGFGAAFYKEDGQVNGELFSANFIKAAKLKTCEIFLDEGEIQLKKTPDGQWLVTSAKNSWSAPYVIVAAGAWTENILNQLNISLGIKPIRGQLLLFDTPQNFIQYPIYTPQSGYIVPKKQGWTLVGTTVEDVGFRNETTEEARHKLMAIAVKFVPELKNCPVRGMSAGLRPGTSDFLPFIGPLVDHKNLIVSAGHYRNGIMLAPITGKIVSDLVQKKSPSVDIAPFSPQRLLSHLS